MTISRACDAHPDVARRVLGIHLEGPYISGSTDTEAPHNSVRDPDWEEIRRLQDACGAGSS